MPITHAPQVSVSPKFQKESYFRGKRDLQYADF